MLVISVISVIVLIPLVIVNLSVKTRRNDVVDNTRMRDIFRGRKAALSRIPRVKGTPPK